MRVLLSLLLAGPPAGLLAAASPLSLAPIQDPPPAPAPDPRCEALLHDLAACAAIVDSAKRLEAYDALSKKLGLAPEAPAQPSGKWSVQVTVSPIDDSKSVILSLPSDTALPGRTRASELPQLVLRCRSGRLDVYVITGVAPEPEGSDPKVTVTLRFDKEKAFEAKVDKSTQGDALFWPDPEANLAKLLGAEHLAFLFTPAGSLPRVLEFDLRGLAQLHPQLAEACPANK